MRDKTHYEHLEKWADYVHSNSDWKMAHTRFIDAQFEKSQSFIKRLAKEKNGRDKIIELYRIKNLAGYKKMLGN